jgi:hypothetical protein
LHLSVRRILHMAEIVERNVKLILVEYLVNDKFMFGLVRSVMIDTISLTVEGNRTQRNEDIIDD